MKPEVLLDVDGVICDFVEGYLKTVDEVVGKKFMAESLTQWGLDEAMGLSGKEKRLVADKVKSPGFCFNLKPLDGAVEMVEMLRKMSSYVYIVTSPWDGPNWEPERVAWLKKHFNFAHRDVIFTHHKHIIDGDIIIDDKMSTLINWKNRRPNKNAVLWHTHHNVNDHAPGIDRVSSAGLLEKYLTSNFHTT